MKLQRPDGMPITQWQDWTPPKHSVHWKEGRSAMESAKAWFRGGALAPPEEILAILDTQARLNGLVLESGIPELVTALPKRGEGRNHDLALIGRTGSEQITVCIEAKADEPFGNQTIGDYVLAAGKKCQDGESTRVAERIAILLAMVGQEFGSLFQSSWATVRYQLLAAIGGTALQAKSDASACAVLIVHEFRTASTKPENLAENELAFKALVRALSGDQDDIADGRLCGPFAVDGIDCFVGKTVAP